jgi:superfamily II RNA helicase
MSRYTWLTRSLLTKLIADELKLGITPPLNPPDFKLAALIWQWSQGSDFETVSQMSNLGGGDIVRLLRQIIQLQRQLLHALQRYGPQLPFDWGRLTRLISRARELINRDVVDAEGELNLSLYEQVSVRVEE